MSRIVVYGASDDLLEIEGDISEEFGCYDIEAGVLACSDGTLLGVQYDGCWRITTRMAGSAHLAHTPADGENTQNYSDRVELVGDIRWVVFSKDGQYAPKPSGGLTRRPK